MPAQVSTGKFPFGWPTSFGGCLILAMIALPQVRAESPRLSPQLLQQVRSLLSNRCFACHGPDADKREGGFRLDQGDSAYQATDSGTVPIVPEHPEKSEVVRRLASSDSQQRMPPPEFGKALDSQEQELIQQWIRAGAPQLKHWSFVAPVRPELPTVDRTELQTRMVAAAVPAVNLDNWLGHPIDRFVLATQVARGLRPSPPATRDAWLRRVSLDLVGLPPTLDLIDSFLNDQRPDANERIVDRLLASPAYGEHWARKWLDLARYADSAGYADDPPRTIWAFRDWVVRALNADQPFDEFTVAQLAGDLLPQPTEEDQVATAFHRNTLTNNEGGTNDEEFRNVAIVDRVNTTMAVWMGLTFNCAQCHTHKYDPFTQVEYFKIFDVFNQTQDADRRDESPLVELFTTEQITQRKAWQMRIDQLQQELDTLTPQVREEFTAWSQSLRAPQWQTLVPLTFKAKTNTEASWDEKRRIRVKPLQDKIVADTFTLELELPSDSQQPAITAIGVRTLPDASLPSGGSGFGGGNFVLTDVRASVAPREASAKTGRWVRVELPGKDKILSLAEVQVFSGETNVALKGKASQSSTDYEGVAARAIDGKTTGLFDKNSTTHTEKSSDPWWEVDLGSDQSIDRVVVWNRNDKGMHTRLDGARVSLLDAQRQSVASWTLDPAPKDSQSLDISGATSLAFAAAFADYQQPDFAAASVIDGDKASGWAIGGQADREHLLTLIPKSPIKGMAGGKLRLELAHDSAHRNHLLGSFDVEISTDSGAAEWSQMNDEQRKWADKPAQERSAAETEALLHFFAQKLAPAGTAARKELADLRQRLAAMKPDTSVPVMRELATAQRRETYVQLRGNYKSLGPKVQSGLPAVFTNQESSQPIDRLQLAHWLTSRENPLSARVMANRLWEALFGLGIVRTSEEFGSQGDLPSHPELLDWLAVELLDLEWDTKLFTRKLILSETYAQTSEVAMAALEADSDNVWLARGPRVRLSAEMVRDQALAVAGLLTHKMHGAPVRPPQPSLGLTAAFGSKTDWDPSQGEDRYRRGLYTTWRRSNPYPSMATFDAPSREVCTLRRDSTNTPLQALVTLNDPGFVEAAQALARRVVVNDGRDLADRQRLVLAFRLTTSRGPTTDELSALENLLRQARQQLAGQTEQAQRLATDPLGPIPQGSDAVELAAWTAVANVLLNLDEVLMKR